jgi:ribonuclease Z
MMKAGLSPYKVSAVFISHLHADHLLGLAGFIQTTAFQGREKELLIFGPGGIRRHVDFYENWDYFKCPYKIKAETLREGTVYENGDCRVSAFRVSHSCPAYGFAFEEKTETNLDVRKLRGLGLEGSPLCRTLKAEGRVRVGKKTVLLEDVCLPRRPGKKIVYTGDTKPTAGIARWARGADMLICDATFGDELRRKAHEYGHMTAADAARAAKAAGARQLVLTHFSPRYDDVSVLVDEAKKIFKNTIAANDLMVVEV